MKIIDFIKNNKVPTIATSVVLVAAIAVGVTFGVLNHKDNIETNKSFGNESSSAGSSSTISVPPIEGNSSVESTSSEESTSSSSDTIETSSTPSKVESVSSAQGSSKPTTTTTKPASSTPSVSNPSTGNNNGGSAGGSTGSSTPSNGGTTSTPANSGGNASSSTPSTSTPSGGNTGSGSGTITTEGDGWHLNITLDCENCGKEYDAALDACPYCGTPFTPGTCPNCGRVRGDGHNGTCAAYQDLFTGKWVCQYFD